METAPAERLYREPRHPYTDGLLHSFPTLHGPRRSMTGIPGSPPDLRAIPSGCAFHPRCSFAFGACQTVVPALRSPSPDAPEQRAACHLYDESLNPNGIPEQLRPASAGAQSDPSLSTSKGES